MNKYLLAASAAAATLMAPAAQASVNIVCPGVSGQGVCLFIEANMTGTFADSFPSAQSFTDNFTLTLTQAYELSITATNTAATGGPISFSTAVLLDSSMAAIGPIAFGAVPTTFSLGAGTYTLQFAGTASDSASYQGTIDIKPVAVPEPATWGLMLVGIGALGAVTRRRFVAARVSFG